MEFCIILPRAEIGNIPASAKCWVTSIQLRTKCIRNTLMRKAGKTQGRHGGCMIFTFTKVFVLLELLLPSFSLARTCWLCCLVICKLQQVLRFYWNTLSSSSVDKMMGMDLWNCTLPNSWLSWAPHWYHETLETLETNVYSLILVATLSETYITI